LTDNADTSVENNYSMQDMEADNGSISNDLEVNKENISVAQNDDNSSNNQKEVNVLISKEESKVLKQAAIQLALDTPRSINLFVHRYLLLRNLILTFYKDTNHDAQKLIDLLVCYQTDNKSFKSIKQEVAEASYRITGKINNKEYFFTKYDIDYFHLTEMVSPFE
jgi:hypothetical protein